MTIPNHHNLLNFLRANHVACLQGLEGMFCHIPVVLFICASAYQVQWLLLVELH